MCVIQYVDKNSTAVMTAVSVCVNFCLFCLWAGLCTHACVCVCSHLSSGSCLWAGVEDSGWSARCCRAGGTSVDASRETAAPPKLCWTVDETQRCNINLDDNDFVFYLRHFLGRQVANCEAPFQTSHQLNHIAVRKAIILRSKHLKFSSFLCTLFCRVNLQVQQLQSKHGDKLGPLLSS